MQATQLVQELIRRSIDFSTWNSVFDIKGQEPNNCGFQPKGASTERGFARLKVCCAGIQIGIKKVFLQSGPEVYEYNWDELSFLSISERILGRKAVETDKFIAYLPGPAGDLLFTLLALGIAAGNSAIGRRPLISGSAPKGTIHAWKLESFFDSSGLPCVVSQDANTAIGVLRYISSKQW